MGNWLVSVWERDVIREASSGWIVPWGRGSVSGEGRGMVEVWVNGGGEEEGGG